MEKNNCLRCNFRHKDNGNCTAVGGFCTAVQAAHCSLLREYLDTGLEPAICANYKTFEDEAISKGVTFKRIVELMDADKDGRVVVSCWIPVTERLPEDSVKECIIFVPRVPENIVGLGRYLGSGRWVLDGWYLTPEAVAYWMPLPEAPYKKALEAMKDG